MMLRLYFLFLSYSADLGSTPESSGRHQMIIGNNVADNNWHSVIVERQQNSVKMTMDKLQKSMRSPGIFSRLDLDDYVFVGGLDKDKKIHAGHEIKLPNATNFIGCLADVRFNRDDITWGAKYELRGLSSYGNIQYKCVDTVYEPIGFTVSHARITVPRSRAANKINIKLRFRTFEANGLVVTTATARGHVTFALINGKGYLNVSFQTLAPEKAISLVLGNTYNDGNWHRLHIRIKESENLVFVAVDKTPKSYQFASHFDLSRELGNFNKPLRLGGPSISYPGFVGCMQEIKIDEKSIKFSSLHPSAFDGITQSCNPLDVCFPNPCKNFGICRQRHGKVICDCSETNYNGDRCQHSLFKRTCDEIRKSGERRSGFYRISPFGVNVIRVYCEMHHPRGPATIVLHNLRNNTRVNRVQLLTDFYIHELKYTSSRESVTNLIASSKSCRQYIRYDCFQSTLLYSLRRYQDEHYWGARWIGRNGNIQNYWGGASPGSKLCRCGVTKTCEG